MTAKSIALAILCFALAGCTAPKDEAKDLTARAETLRDDMQAKSKSEAEIAAEFKALAADVSAWSKRTGGKDVGVIEGENITIARDNGGGGGDSGCDPCPGYTISGDNVCLLETEGECPVPDPEADLDFGRICVYTCIWIGAAAEPARNATQQGG